jgi:hypothetical protein
VVPEHLLWNFNIGDGGKLLEYQAVSTYSMHYMFGYVMVCKQAMVAAGIATSCVLGFSNNKNSGETRKTGI